MSLSIDIDQMLNRPYSNPALIIDGINFGRGDLHTVNLKCWRIVDQHLEELEDIINHFYDEETYVVRWNCVIDGTEQRIFFYWKGESAPKGYSPLPEELEEDNPPVERITQWSEPPAFLQLFAGTLMVHRGGHGSLDSRPRLYILRGEIEPEIHFCEVPPKRVSLRSRTSFFWANPEENEGVIWHGTRSSVHNRKVIRKSVEKMFQNFKFTEIHEGCEGEEFLAALSDDEGGYFVDSEKENISYTPRLFYLNNITGAFLASEVECSHRSEFNTSFPFLQTHLYTATQPAIFLLDDDDEIWLWQGWQRDEDDGFRSECFSTAFNYAKQKSKLTGKLVKVHKVIAGFEPLSFTNLFPTWKKREDVVELQKDGVVPNSNLLIEVTPEDR